MTPTHQLLDPGFICTFNVLPLDVVEEESVVEVAAWVGEEVGGLVGALVGASVGAPEDEEDDSEEPDVEASDDADPLTYKGGPGIG
jgi:hypothetical protein